MGQPKREIAISKWSQIKGPLKNIYNYKPILFNVLDGISRNEIIPTNTCYSNVIYLLKKYEETKEKIIKLKGKDFYLERVLKEDNDICIMISKIKNLPKGLFEQYINFSPYEEVMEHVSKELTKPKIETYEDLDFFD